MIELERSPAEGVVDPVGEGRVVLWPGGIGVGQLDSSRRRRAGQPWVGSRGWWRVVERHDLGSAWHCRSLGPHIGVGPRLLVMGRRFDYYDDPDGPAANSLVPAVNVVVGDEAGRVLMICRTDNGNWALPGGAVDLGESLPDAGVRETLEETGIVCEITGILGTYTDPKHVILYTSDGEVRQEFSIVLIGRALSGEPTPSDESRDVRWVPRDGLAGLRMDRSMRMRISHYLSGSGLPYIG